MNLWIKIRKRWNLIHRRLKGHHISPTLTQKEAAKIGIYYPLDEYLEEAERSYKLCGDEVEALKPYECLVNHNILRKRSSEEDSKRKPVSR